MDKFYNLLGLARRAGKAVLGGAACDAAIKNGKVCLVVLDGSTSERTRKDFTNACSYYHTDLIVLDEIDVLEKCLGKQGGKIMGITDAGLAKKAKELYGEYSGGE